MSPAPRVSVVVLSWNGVKHLETCLPSLLSQTYRDHEIVVCDNGSTDGTETWVRERFPGVRVVRLEKNAGFTGGANFGLENATSELVALVNNDVEFDPNWLAESVRVLDAHPEAGFTASRVRLFHRRTHLDTTGDRYFRNGMVAKRGWLAEDGPAFDREEFVFAASAVAILVRRAMLDEVGLFDEDYFAGVEDLDLSFRAQLLGWRCRYAPGAILYHKVGATLGAGPLDPTTLERMHRNVWFTRIKNLPAALWIRYLPAILATELMLLGGALVRGRPGPLLRARVQVLRALPRMLRKRRAIQRRRRVSAAYLHSMIESGWRDARADEKRREAESAGLVGRAATG
jgi:hypothetical protein